MNLVSLGVAIPIFPKMKSILITELNFIKKNPSLFPGETSLKIENSLKVLENQDINYAGFEGISDFSENELVCFFSRV